jgi:hypothetical protein
MLRLIFKKHDEYSLLIRYYDNDENFFTFLKEVDDSLKIQKIFN